MTNKEADDFIIKAAKVIALRLADGIPIDLAHAIEVCEQVLNLVDVLDYGEGPMRSRLLDALQEARREIVAQWEEPMAERDKPDNI